MAIEQSLIDAVLAHAKIEDVVGSFLELTRKGNEYLAKCPFHDDTNPSMHVSPSKGIFKCFVCGTGGDAIGFVKQYLKVPYIEALKKVAEISGYHDPRLDAHVVTKNVDPKREPLLKCLKDLTLFYEYSLNTNDGEQGLEYFENRKLGNDIRSKYHLGYAIKDGKATIAFLQSKGHSIKTIEDIGIASFRNNEGIDKNQGRVIFPICNPDGEVVGFSARRIADSDEAKYVNSPETYVFNKRTILYNYHIAKDKCHQTNYVYVCEGFMDIFALAKIGIDSAVATMGTALTKEHIELLKRLKVEVRLCLDGDLPGQKAMMEISKQLIANNVPFRVVHNQGSTKDPDEILNTEGPDALKAYLENLISSVDFTLNYFSNTNPLKTTEEKKNLIKEFVPILLALKSQLERDSYIIKLSKITGFEPESITNLLRRVQQSQKTENKEEINNLIVSFHPEHKILRRLYTAERELLYQMLNHKEAIEFYEQKTDGFYDEVHRQIAEFLMDYAQKNEQISPQNTISYIEQSESNNKDELINSITGLCFESTHPNMLDDRFMMDLLQTMKQERQKIFEKDVLESCLAGKSQLEQARIIADYLKQKNKK